MAQKKNDDRPFYPITRAWLERFLRWKGDRSLGEIAKMTEIEGFPFPPVTKQTVSDVCADRRGSSRDLPALSRLAGIPCTEVITPDADGTRGLAATKNRYKNLTPAEQASVDEYIDFLLSRRKS